MLSDPDLLARLGFAALLGGLLGLEREIHHQDAGLRTHMILTLGASLAALTALMIGQQIDRADPARMIGHVLSGIGFLGAGAILKQGFAVQGLTTAAGLWTSAGIGIAAGCGYWKAATAATAGVLLVTALLRKAEDGLLGGAESREIRFDGREDPDTEDRFKALLKEFGFRLRRIEVTRRPADRRIEIKAVARVRSRTDPAALSRALAGLPGAESSAVQ